MKKYISLFLILLNSCVTTQNTSSNLDIQKLWNSPPDLSKVVFEGGDGTSVENAVIIKGAGNSRNGIAAEYEYVAIKLGTNSVDWKLGGQGTSKIIEDNKKNVQTDKKYDLLTFTNVKTSETITFYFDITDFYGKW